MKGKGWWIAGGILLLWISPLFYGLVKSSCFPEKVDQSRNWAAWHKAERQRQRAERLAAWRRIQGYQPSYSSSYRPSSDSGRDDYYDEPKVVYVDRPVVVERVVERPAYDSQPDLSGVYFNQPLKAGQGGYQNFQINYISGPH